MALSPEVKASIIIVAGQWAENIAKMRFERNPKTKYDDELKEHFGSYYIYLEQFFKDDVQDSF
jgi:hypothetical protein